MLSHNDTIFFGVYVDIELLILSGGLIIVALMAFFLRSRFLVQLAGGSLAIAVLWKVGELRGWLLDSKAVILMYLSASIFGWLLGLAVAGRKEARRIG